MPVPKFVDDFIMRVLKLSKKYVLGNNIALSLSREHFLIFTKVKLLDRVKLGCFLAFFSLRDV
jgi:hypothetical protein